MQLFSSSTIQAMVPGSYNCLMYAMGDTDNSRGVFDVFQKYFFQNGGNGPDAFEAMCRELRILFKTTLKFTEANIAIASYLYISGRDYEGFPIENPDCHLIRKVGGIWMEKNEGFKNVVPTRVPSKQLAEWQAGSTSEQRIAYYVI